MIFLADQ